MSNKVYLTLLCVCACVMVTTPALAEVVKIPLSQQSSGEAGLVVPPKGMSKQSVLNEFGEPHKRQAAVGEPPISHWSYEHFRVYFEGEHVIHAVVIHQPKHMAQ